MLPGGIPLDFLGPTRFLRGLLQPLQFLSLFLNGFSHMLSPRKYTHLAILCNLRDPPG
jgi:hypothetical protein